VQLVNLSGQSGVTCHAPIPMRGVTVTVPREGARRAVDLRTGEDVPVSFREEAMILSCPEIREYTCILIPDEP